MSYEKYSDHIRDADIILVTDCLLLNSLHNFLSKKNIKKKIIYWDHGGFQGYLKVWLTNIIYKKEIYLGIKKTKYHFAIATEIKEKILSIKKDAEVFVVYNPVENDNIKRIQLVKNNIFVFVGRFDNLPKNITFLLKGLSKIKTHDWKLLIIGTGPDEQKLKKYAKRLKINSNIEWLGFQKYPFLVIEKAKILLLTSRWEGFPLSLVEANRHGLPVLSSDCKSGPKDIVVNYKNGLLYEEGNLKDFVEKVNNICDNKISFLDQDTIIAFSQKFDKDLVISNIYNILLDIANK